MPSDPRFQDLTGRDFGRLRVKRYVGKRGGRNAWRCRCSCGTWITVITCNLTTDHTSSCGCLSKEINTERMTKHGQRDLREYKIWKSMRQRCTDPRCKSFSDYGGRGVQVCQRWNDFAIFLADMGIRPPNTTIERLDNNGDYTPENCVWASREAQARNRRTTRLVTFAGVTKCLKDWATTVGIKYQTVQKRLDVLGWSVDKALSTPVRAKQR